MKQTAVTWLVIKLGHELPYIPVSEWNKVASIIQEAKEMERQQIIEAHGTKVTCGSEQSLMTYSMKSGEKYYNETFGT